MLKLVYKIKILIENPANLLPLKEDALFKNEHNVVFLKELEEQVKIRTAALVVAHELELDHQVKEKNLRQDELDIANIELVYQNSEKEKRAAEHVVANLEVVYQNCEKAKRSAELKIVNIELVYQNGEKEKRAAELVTANIELSFQNSEKEKRASELNNSKVANVALVFQILEKEKEASELIIANKELAAFNYISSHDLQEPINKIKFFTDRIIKNEMANLSAEGIESFIRIRRAANRMETLISDLMEYSKTSSQERLFEKINLHKVLNEVISDLSEKILEKKATIEAEDLGDVYINVSQFRQVLTNLLTNALKFSKPNILPHIIVKGKLAQGADCLQDNYELEEECLEAAENYYHLRVSDNCIGYEPKYNKKIFEIFQRLHSKQAYKGSGIGLAIVKKIIENHSGKITSDGKVGVGTNFNIYIPSFKLN